MLAGGVGQHECKCLMSTNRNWFRDSWPALPPSLSTLASSKVQVRLLEQLQWLSFHLLLPKEPPWVSSHPFQTSFSDFEVGAPPLQA